MKTYNFFPLPARGKEMIEMANTKKGFILYFNNYPLLASLPMDQRGILVSALMVYADRVWRDSSVTLDGVLEGFPQMSPEARMACGFMGAAVQHDTEVWLSKQGYWQKKRQERQTSSAAADKRIREDIERTRRMVERINAEG